MVWSNSSIEVIEMPSGCRLAAPRLVPDDVSGNCYVLEGTTIDRLVKKGERRARADGLAFRLRLKTGQRGRPQERIILPPKPAPRKPSASPPEDGDRRTSTGDESKTLPKVMPHGQDLAGQISDLKSQLTQVFEVIADLDRKVRSVQAEQSASDLEAKVTRLEAMVEAMRSTWREKHGYTPHHPELPPLSQRTPPIPTGERS